jgi:cyclin L
MSLSGLSHLTNPLAASIQLEISATQLDGVPRDIEYSIRYETARLLQAAGILLRLPQELVAQSIITLLRASIGPDGLSAAEHDSTVGIAAACLPGYRTAPANTCVT